MLRKYIFQKIDSYTDRDHSKITNPSNVNEDITISGAKYIVTTSVMERNEEMILEQAIAEEISSVFGSENFSTPEKE